VYSVQSFGSMIRDSVRVEAYTEALRRAISPDSVVVEIGAGTGYFTLLACRLGARKVYAIEPNDSIGLVRQAAAANGFAGRIECIQKLSTDVELPERAGVLVSDLRGVLPLFGRHIPSIADARKRLLKPGGVQIPRKDRVYAALVSAQRAYGKLVSPWDRSRLDCDWSAARGVVLNGFGKELLEPAELLSDPAHLFTLDYTSLEQPHARGEIELRPLEAGAACGLSVWFEAELHDGVGFSTAPGCADTVYGRAFFPFEEPLPVTPADTVAVDLRADLFDSDYTWTWKTSLNGSPRFTQSTFRAQMLLSPDGLQRTSAAFAPSLSERGEVARFILSQVDGLRTNQQIAAALLAAFPGRFASTAQALGRVAETLKDFQ
jgi:type I protein arginine methyltransferase